MSMSNEDIERAEELEKLLTTMFPDECPFSFSKTVCKALELSLDSLKTKNEPKPKSSTSHFKLGNQKRH